MTLTFEWATDGSSELTSICRYAFGFCDLDYQNESNPLYLPKNITYVGNGAFSGNSNLKYIYFEGDTSGFDNYWTDSLTLLPRRN